MLGRTPPQWLTDPDDARAAIILMSLFTIGERFVHPAGRAAGAAAEVYELAAIEDATGWDVFRRVTLPLMAPVLVLLLAARHDPELPAHLRPGAGRDRGGPPPYATTYLSLFVYRNAFEYLRYGYAAAATLVMLLLTAADRRLSARPASPIQLGRHFLSKTARSSRTLSPLGGFPIGRPAGAADRFAVARGAG